LKILSPQTNDENFRIGLTHLIGIAREHLQNALRYTQLIPAHEKGIRNFCLWALGMAVLTLNKIKRNLNFTHSDQVKITRNHVKATIAITSAIGSNNLLLSLAFNLTSNGLKTPGWHYSIPSSKATTDL
jgi:farnesyl-diphosphate farnesyltransferase